MKQMRQRHNGIHPQAIISTNFTYIFILFWTRTIISSAFRLKSFRFRVIKHFLFNSNAFSILIIAFRFQLFVVFNEYSREKQSKKE